MGMVLINDKKRAHPMQRYNMGCRDEQVIYVKKIDKAFLIIT